MSKQSSAELSALAGRVLATDAQVVPRQLGLSQYSKPGEAILQPLADAKRLAGSVLRQDETPGQNAGAKIVDISDQVEWSDAR